MKTEEKYTCFCNRRFENGADPIYKQNPKLKKIKDKEASRSYPKPEDIIDFDFKPGEKVKVMKKDKKVKRKNTYKPY